MAKAHRSALADKAPGNFKHIFVDFENVPAVDLRLVADHGVDVILFIGKKQRCLELDLVRQIHELADKVTLVEVGASGRNALDFVLAWHLGRISERYPKDPYFVVSKDRDFDPLISHLHTRGLRIERVDGFSLLPFLPKQSSVPPAPSDIAKVVKKALKPAEKAQEAINSPASPSHDSRLAKVMDRLQHKVNGRPVRRKTLLTHINGFYSNQLAESELESVVAILQQRAIIAIDAKGRVEYPSPGSVESANGQR